MTKKKLSEPHKTKEKLINFFLHVMFGAGQYRSTEKGYK